MGTLYTGCTLKTDTETETKTETETEMRRRFKQAATAVTVQHMLSKLATQCFRKCVARPQESLDGREERCIVLCMDRYVDSFNLVARAYGNRLQRELKKSLERESEKQ
ncbi:hypothetical protein ACLKA6_009159 [Drosophila palustris]